MLITFSQSKGGVGKSTLASQLAIFLHDGGYRVALLDADIQATSLNWIKAAEPAITVCGATTMEEIQAAVTSLTGEYDVIVGDSPGEDGEAAQTITLLSDMAIVPLQPSRPDIRALNRGLKAIRLAQQMTGGKRPHATLVLNMVAKRDVQARQLKAQLAAFNMPVAQSEIRRLNALRDACDSSVTRMTTEEGREAAKDLEALFAEIILPQLSPIHASVQPQHRRAGNG
jgi:chromosome partitioning protein